MFDPITLCTYTHSSVLGQFADPWCAAALGLVILGGSLLGLISGKSSP